MSAICLAVAVLICLRQRYETELARHRQQRMDELAHQQQTRDFTGIIEGVDRHVEAFVEKHGVPVTPELRSNLARTSWVSVGEQFGLGNGGAIQMPEK